MLSPGPFRVTVHYPFAIVSVMAVKPVTAEHKPALDHPSHNTTEVSVDPGSILLRAFFLPPPFFSPLSFRDFKSDHSRDAIKNCGVIQLAAFLDRDEVRVCLPGLAYAAFLRIEEVRMIRYCDVTFTPDRMELYIEQN